MIPFPYPREWRWVGCLPRSAAPPRTPLPPQPVRGARPLDATDMATIYGPTLQPRFACMDGHELVTWLGEKPCWHCDGPGMRRN